MKQLLSGDAKTSIASKGVCVSPSFSLSLLPFSHMMNVDMSPSISMLLLHHFPSFALSIFLDHLCFSEQQSLQKTGFLTFYMEGWIQHSTLLSNLRTLRSKVFISNSQMSAATTCISFISTDLPHIVWKLLKMSHLILAFSTNFCPIKTDLSGNTVWHKLQVFKNSPNWPFLAFLILVLPKF